MTSKRFLFVLMFLAFLIVMVSLVRSANAGEVTLSWDANTEEDLAGYKIYYKIDGTGPPYDGTVSDQGPSPIVITPSDDLNPNPDKVQYRITGLPDLVSPERYRFTVTAYDNEQTDPPGGLESGYSNEVDTDGAPINPGNLVVVSSQP